MKNLGIGATIALIVFLGLMAFFKWVLSTPEEKQETSLSKRFREMGF